MDSMQFLSERIITSFLWIAAQFWKTIGADILENKNGEQFNFANKLKMMTFNSDEDLYIIECVTNDTQVLGLEGDATTKGTI